MDNKGHENKGYRKENKRKLQKGNKGKVSELIIKKRLRKGE